MRAEADGSGGGLRDSLRATLGRAREKSADGGLAEAHRIEAELVALDVEVTIMLYLGEDVGCAGVAMEGERAWREAAERLRRQMTLRKRLRDMWLLY